MVLLYDQISAFGFSNHDIPFLNYNMPITSAVDKYVGLNTELDIIYWGQESVR